MCLGKSLPGVVMLRFLGRGRRGAACVCLGNIQWHQTVRPHEAQPRRRRGQWWHEWAQCAGVGARGERGRGRGRGQALNSSMPDAVGTATCNGQASQ